MHLWCNQVHFLSVWGDVGVDFTGYCICRRWIQFPAGSSGQCHRPAVSGVSVFAVSSVGSPTDSADCRLVETLWV